MTHAHHHFTGATMLKRRKPPKLTRGTRDLAAPKSAVTLPQWDFGAQGPANRHGLVEEEATEIDPETGKRVNPNGVKRMRRWPWVDRYMLQGKLTLRQVNAARFIRACAEGRPTQDALAALRIDRSTERPEPAVANFDARRAYHAIMREIPIAYHFVIEWVVVEDKAIRSIPGCSNGHAETRHLHRLQEGIDAAIRHIERAR